MKNKYGWEAFYSEFANSLLKYRTNREKLISIVKEVYQETGIRIPTFERDNHIVDMDPFTVLATFNKDITIKNRILIATAYATKLELKSEVPNNFDGVPTLNPLNATFYMFSDERDNSVIDDLWAFFELALKYGNNQSEEIKTEFSLYFEKAINMKYNGNKKITMGLFWVNSEVFINLDKRNLWYLYDSGKLPKEIVNQLPKVEAKMSAKMYFELLDKVREYIESEESTFDSFCDLSFEAWRYSTEVNKQRKEEKKKREKESKGKAIADEDVKVTRYWMYSIGEDVQKWESLYKQGIIALGWGEIGSIKGLSQSEITQKMQSFYDDGNSYKHVGYLLWQLTNNMKADDVIFVKNNENVIIGRGVVSSEYEYKNEHTCKVMWTDRCDVAIKWQRGHDKLLDITPYTEEVSRLSTLFNSEVNLVEEENSYPEYGEEQFLEEVYMEKTEYDTLVNLLRNKKNIILQGAPGVGKTYVAKRLAYSMMGLKDSSRVMMVQFHQSYSYEDFIEGFRPMSGGSGFEIKKGSFYNFCKKAESDTDNDYFFIIDEINRGNLSKIFGELFMLIENDKRGISLSLLYSDEKFNVPNNVHIIGMMNTADRGLAMLDYALRRRFAFFDMKSGLQSSGFNRYKNSFNSPMFNQLISMMEQLNKDIENDESLGEGFCIGHSYFCNFDKINESDIFNIIEYEIIPLLKEYWFDEKSKVTLWTTKLRGVLQ